MEECYKKLSEKHYIHDNTLFYEVENNWEDATYVYNKMTISYQHSII